MENHFKNVFGVYDGLHTDTLRHIPEISCYNHNYYIGLKRGNSTIHDLLFAVSNDDSLTEWYIVLGNCIKYIGYEYSDKGVIYRRNNYGIYNTVLYTQKYRNT